MTTVEVHGRSISFTARAPPARQMIKGRLLTSLDIRASSADLEATSTAGSIVRLRIEVVMFAHRIVPVEYYPLF